MVKFHYYIVLFLFSLFANPAAAQNQVKKIVKCNIDGLAPYNYDAYAVKEISFGAKEQSIVIEFSVFSDEEYKLLFCKTTLPHSVDIYIYDGDPKNPKSKLLYFDESGKKDQYVCNFRPKGTGSYFIEYKVPASAGKNQSGYIIVLIGVKTSDTSLVQK